jgi:hypothetical protein
MTIQEFSHKYNFKQTDKVIASKVYASTEMTEEKWVDKLKNEFVFDSSILSKPKVVPVVKIEPVVVIVPEELEDENEIEQTKDSEVESDVETKPTITKEEKLAKIKSKSFNKK